MQRKILWLVFLTCILPIIGCSYLSPYKIYSVSELPESQVCFLVKNKPIGIWSLDGDSHWSRGKGIGQSTYILELGLGSHRLAVSYSKKGERSQGDVFLEFVGEADHVYRIEYDIKEYGKIRRWKPRIEDITYTEFTATHIMPLVRRHKAKKIK